MRQLKTSDGDLVVSEGLLQVVSGRECLAQTIAQRLQTVRGEWRYDLSHGIPFLQTLSRKGASDDLIRSVIREALIETPGVVRVKSITLTRDRAARTMTISGEVVAEDGSTVLFSPVRIDSDGNL